MIVFEFALPDNAPQRLDGTWLKQFWDAANPSGISFPVAGYHYRMRLELVEGPVPVWLPPEEWQVGEQVIVAAGAE